MRVLLVSLAVAVLSQIAWAQNEGSPEAPFPGKKGQWQGFDIYTWKGRKVVVPKKTAPGKPWIWRARVWGHQPAFDVAMLNKGYHLVYRDVGNLFGNREAVERWNGFYKYLTEKHGFAEKAVLEGMSRGGLIIYNWAIANPEKVAVIYGDAPVMDLKSWPRYGNKAMIRAYNFKDVEGFEAFQGNPVDNLEPLAKAGVPIIHVVGDADKVVPVAENTAVAEKRYKAMGGVFEVIHKAGIGHHPHALKDPAPLLEFVERHSGRRGKAKQ